MKNKRIFLAPSRMVELNRERSFFMQINIHAIYPATYLNMLSEIMKELNLHGLVDSLVPTDTQTRTSDIVQLMVLDILSGHQALVHLEKWAGQIDLEKLVRAGLSLTQLNDDAIGRHLDRLYEAGIRELVSTFLLRTYQHEKMPLNLFHGDTTSMSLYGAYNRPTDALNITYGYSRDQAGMKQIQFGLIGNQGGIPFYADVHDATRPIKTVSIRSSRRVPTSRWHYSSPIRTATNV